LLERKLDPVGNLAGQGPKRRAGRVLESMAKRPRKPNRRRDNVSVFCRVLHVVHLLAHEKTARRCALKQKKEKLGKKKISERGRPMSGAL
jgi:hypothetical protein